MKNIALTPPKGWNSWNIYGASVTEQEVRNNAQVMAEKLKAYGWEYVVVDIQWY
ncbi:alpha-galactosidase, partial [Raoultella ornithinolytica]|nr:alpha-galactosidase [Raoultella ornithinolytica]